jgi:integrase
MDAHTLDLSVLPAERRRFLAGLGRRLTAQNLARRDDDRKYPILLTLAAQSAVDVLDEVLLLFDQALSGREAAARERLTEVLAERARGGEHRQALLDDILAIVLDPDVGDDQVGGRLRRDVGHGRMRAAHEARRERLPRDHGHLALMDASMSYLRQFVPDVLAAVGFAGGPGMDDLLQAAGILARLHATRARKVPDGAPDSFIFRQDAPVREKSFWRLTYESAARAEEILTLDVPDLDLASKRGRTTAKGGDKEWIHWQTGSALLLPRLLAGRTRGPVFLADRKPVRAVAAADLCPITGRARLSYRRAEEIFELATRALANPGASKAELEQLRGWTLHQLRHSRLTHEAEDGTNTPTLLAISRHASVRSLERYARPGVDAVAAHVAATDPATRRRRR